MRVAQARENESVALANWYGVAAPSCRQVCLHPGREIEPLIPITALSREESQERQASHNATAGAPTQIQIRADLIRLESFIVDPGASALLRSDPYVVLRSPMLQDYHSQRNAPKLHAVKVHLKILVRIVDSRNREI